MNRPTPTGWQSVRDDLHYRFLQLLLLTLLPGVVTCAAEPVEGAAVGDCSDGADNDGDGLFDCNDPDCVERAVCLTSVGDDDDSSIMGCRPGEMLDCNANCAPIKWLGDGQCDDGAYPYYGNLINFACPDLEYDSGDCEPSTGDDDDTGDDDTGDDDSAVDVLSFADIYGLVLMNCNCHSNSAHESGFAFEGSQSTLYEMWLGAGNGAPSFQNSSMNRITPGDSTQSYVMHKLDGTHLSAGGVGSRMPQGGPFLSDEQLDGIRAWINAGASNGQ